MPLLPRVGIEEFIQDALTNPFPREDDAFLKPFDPSTGLPKRDFRVETVEDHLTWCKGMCYFPQFPVRYPDSIKTQDEFIQHYTALRYKALERPVVVSDCLQLFPPPTFPTGKHSCINALPRLKSDRVAAWQGDIPLSPKLPIQANDVLTITGVLQNGNFCRSQVYTATTAGSEIEFVVKIFQDSLIELPFMDERAGDGPPPEDFEIGWAQAACEQATYEYLLPFQGWMIPHCYGIYEFHLPCGEIACGLVLEKLDVYTFPDFFVDKSRTWVMTEGSQILEQALIRLRFLHLCGITHGDLLSGNILWNTARSAIQFIDFTHMQPCFCLYHNYLESRRLFSMIEMAHRLCKEDLQSMLDRIGVCV